MENCGMIRVEYEYMDNPQTETKLTIEKIAIFVDVLRIITLDFPIECVICIFNSSDLGARRTQDRKDILYDKNKSSPTENVLLSTLSCMPEQNQQ